MHFVYSAQLRLRPRFRAIALVVAGLLSVSSTAMAVEDTAPEASWLDQAQHEAVASAPAMAAAANNQAASDADGGTSWSGIVIAIVLALAMAALIARRPRQTAPASTTNGDGSARRLRTAPGSTPRRPSREPESPGSQPAAKPPSTGLARRLGFTVLEVMIAVAVMATALSALVSTIFTLNVAHQGNKETAKAQEIAQLLIERVQGGSWHALGRQMSSQSDLNAWSWHRRDGAGVTEPVPLSELDTAVVNMDITVGTADDYHLAINNPLMLDPNPLTLPATGFDLARAQAIRAANGLAANRPLRGLGLWTGASGLRNLRVYLEYYDMSVCADALSGDWQCNSRTDWATRRANPTFVLARDPAVIDLTEVRNAVVFRVLLRWDSISGAPRTHDVLFARRR